MFEIIEGILKEPTAKWHKYLEGKKLLLCSSIEGNWNLIGIKNEITLYDFCDYAWSVEDEHDYETLEDFKADVEDGNTGFTLLRYEVEVLKTISKAKL